MKIIHIVLNGIVTFAWLVLRALTFQKMEFAKLQILTAKITTKVQVIAGNATKDINFQQMEIAN